ncbi:putative FAD/NAD-containing protein [Saccharolobus shibatae B12]|uniref:FAD/NAD-containing protein n=2 Tax=Saccharolobus TaxID=2100760 RepID=A0A8F5BLE6_SACSH|nr:FAD-dependent oxidoreductase [Saccharolobus shibatae]QXJ27266.1 putative FAD/NAD-containing protein [Saccharolobus shibatae B12]
METEKVVIVGAGYSGLNAYYELGNHIVKTLIADKAQFVFYTTYLQKLMFNKNIKYTANIKPTITSKVKEIDLERKTVKIENGTEIQGHKLILAMGCKRERQLDIIGRIIGKDRVSISVENHLDEYLGIQLAFYLRKLNKEVSYYGPVLKWLGEKVSTKVLELLEKNRIRLSEKSDDIIPACEPNEVIGDFLPINDKLEYKNDVFVIGDMIKNYPKLGELAMREGIYVGKLISKKINESFKPIFINIIDTGKGGAIHIRSNVPWNGNFESVRVSKLRAIMKRFIERYYIIRKGKMGILYNL